MESAQLIDVKWKHEVRNGKDINRRFMQPLLTGYTSVMEKISEVLPEFQGFIYWKDEDGDLMSVSSNEEFSHAAYLPANQKLFRLFTFELPKSAEAVVDQALTAHSKATVSSTKHITAVHESREQEVDIIGEPKVSCRESVADSESKAQAEEQTMHEVEAVVVAELGQEEAAKEKVSLDSIPGTGDLGNQSASSGMAENSEPINVKWKHEFRNGKNITHRLLLPRWTGYATMKKKIAEVMPNFRGDITWKDEDGDLVAVSNNEEFRHVASEPLNQKLFRLFTFEPSKPVETKVDQAPAAERNATSNVAQVAVTDAFGEGEAEKKKASVDSLTGSGFPANQNAQLQMAENSEPINVKWKHELRNGKNITRRLLLPRWTGHAAMMEKIKEVVPKFEGDVSWKDEDGDLVSVSTNEEFRCAASEPLNQKLFRLFTFEFSKPVLTMDQAPTAERNAMSQEVEAAVIAAPDQTEPTTKKALPDSRPQFEDQGNQSAQLQTVENSKPIDVKWSHEAKNGKNIIRRLLLPRLTGYTAMMERIIEVMPNFRGDIAWKDEDGDLVPVSSNEEFRHAASEPLNQKLFRLFTFEFSKPVETVEDQALPAGQNAVLNKAEATVAPPLAQRNTAMKAAPLDSSSQTRDLTSVKHNSSQDVEAAVAAVAAVIAQRNGAKKEAPLQPRFPIEELPNANDQISQMVAARLRKLKANGFRKPSPRQVGISLARNSNSDALRMNSQISQVVAARLLKLKANSVQKPSPRQVGISLAHSSNSMELRRNSQSLRSSSAVDGMIGALLSRQVRGASTSSSADSSRRRQLMLREIKDLLAAANQKNQAIAGKEEASTEEQIPATSLGQLSEAFERRLPNGQQKQDGKEAELLGQLELARQMGYSGKEFFEAVNSDLREGSHGSFSTIEEMIVTLSFVQAAGAPEWTLECSICDTDGHTEEDMITCSKEQHEFCKECVKAHSAAQLSEGANSIKCMSDACEDGFFKLATLQKVLEPDLFEQLSRRNQQAEITAANLEFLEECPFCDFAIILENPEDTVFRCLRPDCRKNSCRLCHKEEHQPLPCDQVGRDFETERRKYIEECMAEAIIRKCPNCKNSIMKVSGCNHMTCPCGCHFCYQCNAQLDSSNPYSHFRSSGCSQDISLVTLHREAALNAGRMALGKFNNENQAISERLGQAPNIDELAG